jgi:hypothetical protein
VRDARDFGHQIRQRRARERFCFVAQKSLSGRNLVVVKENKMRKDTMLATELLPKVQALPRADKLRLMQFLVFELAREEGVPLLQPNQDYPIWTPYDAFDAAETLLNALAEEHITYAD